MKSSVFRLFVAVLCVLSLQLAVVTAAFTPPVAAHASAHPLQHVATPPACPQPPQNVDLTTLSDAALHLYGLPSHATMAQNLQHWAAVLSHAKQRVCSAPAAAPSQSPQPLATCPQPTSLCTSYNWAANIANQPNNQRGVYHSANVDFHVPSIKLNDSNAAVALWAGVGGDGSVTKPTVLVQAGVFITEPNGRQYNESFWEVVPGFTEQNLPLCRLNVGDYVDSYVEADLNGSEDDWFYITNETASCYNSCYLATGPNAQFTNTCISSGGYNSAYASDSATGECIVERPGPPGNQYDLAQFQESGQPTNTVKLRTCLINNTAVGSQSHHYDQIKGNNGWIATVGAIVNNGQDFPVTWLGSQ